MLFVIPAAALAVTGLALMTRAAFAAPEGEEDQQGFHRAAPDTNVPAPVILSQSDLLFFRQ